MKIKKIYEDRVEFNNENKLSFYYCPDCCEYNYADFEYLRDEGGIMDFDFSVDLLFEKIDNYGFRFGSKEGMIFVPCYSK